MGIGSISARPSSMACRLRDFEKAGILVVIVYLISSHTISDQVP